MKKHLICAVVLLVVVAIGAGLFAAAHPAGSAPQTEAAEYME